MATTKKKTASRSKSTAKRKSGTAKRSSTAKKSSGAKKKASTAKKSSGAKKSASSSKSKSSGAKKASARKRPTARKSTKTKARTSATSKRKTSAASKSPSARSKNTPPRSKTTVRSKTAKSPRATASRTTPRPATKKKTTTSKTTPTRKRTLTAPKKPDIISRAVEPVTNLVTGSGQTNAIDLLKGDHDRVEDLFARVKSNEDGDNTGTFTQVKKELDVHTHIEEQVFYPHLLRTGDTELQKLTREALEEHAQAKLLLAELAMNSGSSPDFEAKLKVLIEDIEHHVQEEEDEMFPMVEDQIESETLVRLGTLMEGEKVRFTSGSTRSASAR